MKAVEFSRDNLDVALSWIDPMTRSSTGWINLEPVPLEEVVSARPGLLGSLFSSRGPVVPLITWLTPNPKTGRSGYEQIGVMHCQGQQISKRLGDFGVSLPDRWTVRQDHPSRGLVINKPTDGENRSTLIWLLDFGEAISGVDLTGTWTVEPHEIPKS